MHYYPEFVPIHLLFSLNKSIIDQHIKWCFIKNSTYSFGMGLWLTILFYFAFAYFFLINKFIAFEMLIKLHCREGLNGSMQ